MSEPEKTPRVGTKIDLRGLTVDEALDRVLEFIDRCLRDAERKLVTALLVDGPKAGAAMDCDDIDAVLAVNRAEFAVWREEFAVSFRAMYARPLLW